MSIDLEALSPLIGMIYETILDPERWSDVLGAMCRTFNSLAATLNFHEMIERRGLLTAEYGTDPTFSQLYVERYAADIADRFGLSVPTVRSHLHRLFQKTETSAQGELIAKATRLFPSFAPSMN